ncbi:putative UDP-glucose flavonoid 3-O-glucosyltransferase 3 [Forsythia ovata]|uniref:UDP-glucose flavonoid 3-O-glucosyltransferase 3 n=1 Tax=Forsythia ovata TaxID=205694 RepID=A0ABD1RKL9_9LAMI
MREAVIEIINFKSFQVAGVIVDMFCVNMIDVADEFKIMSYVFFPSSAGFLAIMLQVQVITDEFKQDITKYKDTDKELLIPGFLNLRFCLHALLGNDGAWVVRVGLGYIEEEEYF